MPAAARGLEGEKKIGGLSRQRPGALLHGYRHHDRKLRQLSQNRLAPDERRPTRTVLDNPNIKTVIFGP